MERNFSCRLSAISCRLSAIGSQLLSCRVPLLARTAFHYLPHIVSGCPPLEEVPQAEEDLAWDMDTDTLDLKRDRDIIIPRALLATTPATFLNDISNLEQVYTSNEIVKELKSTKERISNKVCILVAERYHVPVFARFPRGLCPHRPLYSFMFSLVLLSSSI